MIAISLDALGPPAQLEVIEVSAPDIPQGSEEHLRQLQLTEILGEDPRVNHPEGVRWWEYEPRAPLPVEVSYSTLHQPAVPDGVTEYPLPPGQIYRALLSVDPGESRCHAAFDSAQGEVWELRGTPELSPRPAMLEEESEIGEREWIQSTLALLRPPPILRPGPTRPDLQLYRALSRSTPWIWSTHTQGYDLHPGYLRHLLDDHQSTDPLHICRLLAESTGELLRSYPALADPVHRRPYGREGGSGLSALIYQPYARPDVSTAPLWYLGGLLYPTVLPPPSSPGHSRAVNLQMENLWKTGLATLDHYATEVSYQMNALYSYGQGSLLTEPLSEVPDQTVWVWFRGVLPRLDELWEAVSRLFRQVGGLVGEMCLDHWERYLAGVRETGPPSLPEPLQSQVACYYQAERLAVESISAIYDRLGDQAPELYPLPTPDRYRGEAYSRTTYYSRLHHQLVPAPIPGPDPLPPARYSVPDNYYHNIPHPRPSPLPDLPLRPPRRSGDQDWWRVTHRWAERMTQDPHGEMEEVMPEWWDDLYHQPREEAESWRRVARMIVPPELWREEARLSASLLRENRRHERLANLSATEEDPLPLLPRSGYYQFWPLENWVDRVELVDGGRVVESVGGEWCRWWNRMTGGTETPPFSLPLPLTAFSGGYRSQSTTAMLRVYWKPLRDWAAVTPGCRLVPVEVILGRLWLTTLLPEPSRRLQSSEARASEEGLPLPVGRPRQLIQIPVSEEDQVVPPWPITLAVLFPEMKEVYLPGHQVPLLRPDLPELLQWVWRELGDDIPPIWAELARVRPLPLEPGAPYRAWLWVALSPWADVGQQALIASLARRDHWERLWDSPAETLQWWGTLCRWYGLGDLPDPVLPGGESWCSAAIDSARGGESWCSAAIDSARGGEPGWWWIWALAISGDLDPATPGLWEACQKLARIWADQTREREEPDRWERVPVSRSPGISGDHLPPLGLSTDPRLPVWCPGDAPQYTPRLGGESESTRIDVRGPGTVYLLR